MKVLRYRKSREINPQWSRKTALRILFKYWESNGNMFKVDLLKWWRRGAREWNYLCNDIFFHSMLVIELSRDHGGKSHSSGAQVKTKSESCEILVPQGIFKDYMNKYTMKNKPVKACLFILGFAQSKWAHKSYLFDKLLFCTLTHFLPMFHFYTPRKSMKNSGFVTYFGRYRIEILA